MATITKPRATGDSDFGLTRFVFSDVRWDDYEAMLRIASGRRLFVTYDRGEMEIMSPIWAHGHRAWLLSRFVEVIAEELDIPMGWVGRITFKRRDLARGIEPSGSYYLRDGEKWVRGKGGSNWPSTPRPALSSRWTS